VLCFNDILFGNLCTVAYYRYSSLYYADQTNRRRHDIMLEQYVYVILSIYFSSNNSPYDIFSLAPRYRLNNPAVLVNIYIYTYPHTYTDINIYKYNSYAYFYGADKFMTNLQTSGYASVCVCVKGAIQQSDKSARDACLC